MGLFGFSAEKQLRKGHQSLEAGRLFDALAAFREVLYRAAKVDAEHLRDAEQGERTTRERMIETRLGEADSLLRSGDLELARDRCLAALDLAGEDLPTDRIEEKMRELAAPRRPVSSSEKLEDQVPKDVPPSPEQAKRSRKVVADETDPNPSSRGPVDERAVFGDDPDALFEILMNTVEPEVAEQFRAMGRDFHLAYLALASGEGELALRHLDVLSWEPMPPDAVLLERMRALVLARRFDEAIEWGGKLRGQTEASKILRIEALRGLRQTEEALAEAEELMRSIEEPTPESDSLVAWLLIEAGRDPEAYELLEGWLATGEPIPDVMIPAAIAASSMGKTEEAIELLENLIQYALDSALRAGREPAIPVEAARRLLALYQETNAERDRVRPLVSLLLDFDRERGEEYRHLLLQLDRR